jgi:hypothetical protein
MGCDCSFCEMMSASTFVSEFRVGHRSTLSIADSEIFENYVDRSK